MTWADPALALTGNRGADDVSQVLKTALSVPEINDLVRVTLGAIDDPAGVRYASDVPSRVEDLETSRSGAPLRYRIAAPWFTGDLEPPAEGTECSLQWVSPRGLCWLPCTFVEQETTATGVRIWVADVAGDPRREERRRFARVRWAVTVELAVQRDLRALSEAARQRVQQAGIQARLLDLPDDLFAEATNLSEGGMRCLSPVPQLPAGLPLRARFTLDHSPFDVDAHVVWSQIRPEAGIGRRVETALAFDQPQEHGVALGPLLRAAQLRATRDGTH
jgi:PilZ domain